MSINMAADSADLTAILWKELLEPQPLKPDFEMHERRPAQC